MHFVPFSSALFFRALYIMVYMSPYVALLILPLIATVNLRSYTNDFQQEQRNAKIDGSILIINIVTTICSN